MAVGIGGGTGLGNAFGGDNVGIGSSGAAGDANVLTVAIGGNAVGHAVAGSSIALSDASGTPGAPDGSVVTPASAALSMRGGNGGIAAASSGQGGNATNVTFAVGGDAQGIVEGGNSIAIANAAGGVGGAAVVPVV